MWRTQKHKRMNNIRVHMQNKRPQPSNHQKRRRKPHQLTRLQPQSDTQTKPSHVHSTEPEKGNLSCQPMNKVVDEKTLTMVVLPHLGRILFRVQTLWLPVPATAIWSSHVKILLLRQKRVFPSHLSRPRLLSKKVLFFQPKSFPCPLLFFPLVAFPLHGADEEHLTPLPSSPVFIPFKRIHDSTICEQEPTSSALYIVLCVSSHRNSHTLLWAQIRSPTKPLISLPRPQQTFPVSKLRT